MIDKIEVTETHYRDYNGKLVWKEKMVFSRLHAVGEVMIVDSVEYKIRRVAVADNVQHVNFEILNSLTGKDNE